MEEKEVHYKTDGIKVLWKPHKCQHSGNCVKGLPNVFKPKERPWISIDAASADELAQTIDTCPSGALSYIKDDKS